ncbi:UNVERIFIED_CONTAM: VQ motif-containing protein 25 [Sesamum radiatum]|uniref:VQ motif-containing protein 25 n=1 Tax=Sesamum radiatum TaxID=300843 RepID=A0AAW2LFA4_SESRA
MGFCFMKIWECRALAFVVGCLWAGPSQNRFYGCELWSFAGTGAGLFHLLTAGYDEKIICPENNSSSITSHAQQLPKDDYYIQQTEAEIRIIHIFAPEIIKTDAANFRELVQRLTGNPINTDESRHNICSRKKIRSRSRMVPTRQDPRIFVSNRKQELGVTSECAGFREMRNTKGDDREEVWRGGGNTVFAEFDEGFMQEIDDHHDDGFQFMESTTDLMDMSMGRHNLLKY